MLKKKIAIIGAGFAGLAIAWYLSKQPETSIDVYDAKPIGHSTSGIAAGLLHPYAGLHAKLNQNGYEGYEASQELLKAASQAIGTPVYANKGLLRLATTEQALADYAKSAQKHDDVTWLTAEECQKLAPGSAYQPGIYIKKAQTVYTHFYLNGLLKASKAHLIKSSISQLSDLSHYDSIILANGYWAASFPEAKHLPLYPVRGQLIELAWPAHIPPIQVPLNAQAYLIMNPDLQSCIAGATYERGTADLEPNLQCALQDLMPKIKALIPALHDAKVISCKVGVRASTPNHLPILEQLDKKTWVLTGMGSKGLLYHALYAKKLAEKLLS